MDAIQFDSAAAPCRTDRESQEDLDVATIRRGTAPDDQTGCPATVPASAAEMRERDVPLDTLVRTVVAAFRQHGHIGNVMTHISGAHWNRIEEALHVVLDPYAGRAELSPLAENIVDLICADSGVTGRTLKPYFQALLVETLPPDASRLSAHMTCLFAEKEARRNGKARLAAGRAQISRGAV